MLHLPAPLPPEIRNNVGAITFARSQQPVAAEYATFLLRSNAPFGTLIREVLATSTTTAPVTIGVGRDSAPGGTTLVATVNPLAITRGGVFNKALATAAIFSNANLLSSLNGYLGQLVAWELGVGPAIPIARTDYIEQGYDYLVGRGTPNLLMRVGVRALEFYTAEARDYVLERIL